MAVGGYLAELEEQYGPAPSVATPVVEPPPAPVAPVQPPTKQSYSYLNELEEQYGPAPVAQPQQQAAAPVQPLTSQEANDARVQQFKDRIMEIAKSPESQEVVRGLLQEPEAQKLQVKNYVEWMGSQGRGSEVPGNLQTLYTQATGNKITPEGQIAPQTRAERAISAVRGSGIVIAESLVGAGAAITTAGAETRGGFESAGLRHVAGVLDQTREDLKDWRANNPNWFARKSTESAADYLKDPFQAVADALESSGYMASIGITSAINPALGVATAMSLGVGEIYGVARDAGADTLQATMYGLVAGPVYGGIELIGWHQIAGFSQPLKSKVYKSVTRRLLSKLTTAGGSLAEKEVVLALTEGLEEGLQGVIEQGVITLVSGEKINVSEFLNRFGKDFVQGGIVASIMGNAGMAVNLINRGKSATSDVDKATFSHELTEINNLIEQGANPNSATEYVLAKSQPARPGQPEIEHPLGITPTTSGPEVAQPPTQAPPEPATATPTTEPAPQVLEPEIVQPSPITGVETAPLAPVDVPAS